jgi:hypothetical protein
VGALFDDTEPEAEPSLEKMDETERSEALRTYFREGLEDLQAWLREQTSG